MRRSILSAVLAGAAFIGGSAEGASVTYTFNDVFSSYQIYSISGTETGPGGTLTGTLSFDTGAGGPVVTGYDLASFLPGPWRSAAYTFGGSNQLVNWSGNVLQLISKGGSHWEVLTLDFGSSVIGDTPIALTASEKYFNCRTIFAGGFPRNSCAQPNFGVGGGTGVAGANGGTDMRVSAEGAVAAVPLPAGFPMLLAGLAALGMLRRRNSNA